MSDATTITLTNRRLEIIYTALAILGNRKLPSPAADFKISRRLESMKPAIDAWKATRKKIIEEHTTKDGSLEHASDLQRKLQELDELETEIPKPKSLLSLSDLPRALKGTIRVSDGSTHDGEMNAAGLGAIVADLGPEFFATPPEDEE